MPLLLMVKISSFQYLVVIPICIGLHIMEMMRIIILKYSGGAFIDIHLIYYALCVLYYINLYLMYINNSHRILFFSRPYKKNMIGLHISTHQTLKLKTYYQFLAEIFPMIHMIISLANLSMVRTIITFIYIHNVFINQMLT